MRQLVQYGAHHLPQYHRLLVQRTPADQRKVEQVVDEFAHVREVAADCTRVMALRVGRNIGADPETA